MNRIGSDSFKETEILFGSNTGRQSFIDNYINKIKETFKLSPSYYQVTKNNDLVTLYDCWITEVKDDEQKDGVQKKRIIMYPDQLLEYGDYIDWQNEIWLTVDKSISPYYDNGDLQKVNNFIKFKASNGTIQNLPCVMSFLSRNYLDIQSDKLITIPKDSFVCKLQKNNYSSQIIESMRILINSKAFKIVAVADMLVKNIIEVKLISDLLRSDDNLITGLASQTIVVPTTPTNLVISGSTSVKISTSSNYTISNNTNSNTFTWSIVDAITLGATTYGSITSSTTTTCTVKANATAGKQMKLLATCIEVPTTVLTIILTVSSGF